MCLLVLEHGTVVSLVLEHGTVVSLVLKPGKACLSLNSPVRLIAQLGQACSLYPEYTRRAETLASFATPFGKTDSGSHQ